MIGLPRFESNMEPIAEPWWLYRARPTNVVDGDTIDVTVDMGFDIRRGLRVRLADVDTAEIYGPNSGDEEEYQRGLDHKHFVTIFFEQALSEWHGEWPILLATDKDETGKYGRYIARIQRRSDTAILNEELKEKFDL